MSYLKAEVLKQKIIVVVLKRVTLFGEDVKPMNILHAQVSGKRQSSRGYTRNIPVGIDIVKPRLPVRTRSTLFPIVVTFNSHKHAVEILERRHSSGKPVGKRATLQKVFPAKGLNDFNLRVC